MESHEVLIGGKYVLKHKIGKGSFGQVYSGYNKETNERVAIKLEQVDHKSQQLLHEAKIYKTLQGESKIFHYLIAGISKLHWVGIQGDFNVMIIDLLGQNLEELRLKCNSMLSQATALQVADQLVKLARIQYVHSKDFIHRDIKPENFLIGTKENANTIYIIDFGLAIMYKDGATGYHIPFKTHCSMVGTARYASVNTHLGVEQSRRDDLESIGFLLIYLLKGCLPWQEPKGGSRKDKNSRIMGKKIGTSPTALCTGIMRII